MQIIRLRCPVAGCGVILPVPVRVTAKSRVVHSARPADQSRGHLTVSVDLEPDLVEVHSHLWTHE